jgi:hypothetical protein
MRDSASFLSGSIREFDEWIAERPVLDTLGVSCAKAALRETGTQPRHTASENTAAADEHAAEERDEADREALETLDEGLEEEREVMTNVVDALGYVIKGARADILPLFRAEVQPLFNGLLQLGDRQPALAHNALCAYVDVAEWCGAAAADVARPLVDMLRALLAVDDAELRQVAAYGIGALAITHPRLVAGVRGGARALVQDLTKIVEQEDAQEEENIYATENAVAAIVKIAKFAARDRREAQTYWEHVLNMLPLQEDPIEARFTTKLIVQEVAQGDSGSLRSKDALTQVGRIFTSVLVGSAGGGADSDDLAVPETLDAMREMLPGIVRSVGADRILRAGDDYGFGDAERDFIRSLP